jgi:hypothetical protein
MAIIDNSDYVFFKNVLKHRIQDHDIYPKVCESVGHTCFLCIARKDDVMFVLEDRYVIRGVESIGRYYVHKECLDILKAF